MGIPSILTPENVIEFADEKSIMTYVSLLYKTFLGTSLTHTFLYPFFIP
jgi:hypothetical protein